MAAKGKKETHRRLNSEEMLGIYKCCAALKRKWSSRNEKLERNRHSFGEKEGGAWG